MVWHHLLTYHPIYNITAYWVRSSEPNWLLSTLSCLSRGPFYFSSWILSTKLQSLCVFHGYGIHSNFLFCTTHCVSYWSAISIGQIYQLGCLVKSVDDYSPKNHYYIIHQKSVNENSPLKLQNQYLHTISLKFTFKTKKSKTQNNHYYNTLRLKSG